MGVQRALRSVSAAPATPGPAVNPGGFSARSYTEGGVVYRYQIFFPRDYDASRRWPTIISFHGTGEQGSDGERQARQALGQYVRSHASTFPAVVIFPQAPNTIRAPGYYGPIRRLLDEALRDVNADSTRLYLMGFSSGGVMAYNFVYAAPGRYAALVPIGSMVTILPGSDSRRLSQPDAYAAAAKALGTTPVWMFHGSHDDTAPIALGREAARALQAAGVNLRFTEVPDGGHDVSANAFAMPEFWSWMLSQHR
jgi:predicted peptidase